jgi:hypothetical protein
MVTRPARQGQSRTFARRGARAWRARLHAWLLLAILACGQVGMLAHALSPQPLGALCTSPPSAGGPTAAAAAAAGRSSDGAWILANVHCAWCHKVDWAPPQAPYDAVVVAAIPAIRPSPAPRQDCFVHAGLRPPVRAPPTHPIERSA